MQNAQLIKCRWRSDTAAFCFADTWSTFNYLFFFFLLLLCFTSLMTLYSFPYGNALNEHKIVLFCCLWFRWSFVCQWSRIHLHIDRLKHFHTTNNTQIRHERNSLHKKFTKCRWAGWWLVKHWDDVWCWCLLAMMSHHDLEQVNSCKWLRTNFGCNYSKRTPTTVFRPFVCVSVGCHTAMWSTCVNHKERNQWINKRSWMFLIIIQLARQ